MSEQEFESNAIVAGEALDPANFQTILLIMLNRIYDVNMALLLSVNPDKGAELYAMHEAGVSLAPPPAVAIDDEADV